MAEIPTSSSFEESGSSDFAMRFAHRGDAAEIKDSSEFVALDIGSLSLLAENDSTSSPQSIKTFSRKGSLRGLERKAAPAVEGDGGGTGGTNPSEKSNVSAHVAGGDEVVKLYGTPTPTRADGGKLRRLGSRRSSTAWLDPRRVLYIFATLSSMGTLILIYFTLSMAKMSGAGDANAR